MGFIERKILIVDDSKSIAPKVRAYKRIFEKLKSIVDEIKDIDLVIKHIESMEDALDYLRTNSKEIYHAILVDYNFDNDASGQKGEYLVREIRRQINKKCKIIFYTMDSIDVVDAQHLINLINNDVFRFILKSSMSLPDLEYPLIKNATHIDQYIVETMIDSIKELDPIALSLEEYIVKYNDRLSEFQVNIDGKSLYLSQLLDEIRLETEIGEYFVKNILSTSIMNSIRFLK